jgi:hypothetical protein
MENQDYAVAVLALILSAGIGFAAHQEFFTEQKFSKSLDIRIDNENSEETIQFQNHSFGLTYENFQGAKFYYNFNDSRGTQQMENLEIDGQVHTFRDIKSFGRDTYFLYFRYQDDAEEFGDGWMELYRIEGA